MGRRWRRIIKNFRRGEILENYVAAPSDSATLVMAFKSWPKTTRLHKALDKVGGVRWCEAIKEPQVPAWIIKRAKEGYGKNIEPAATELLAELIGPDLQRLDNELAKLSLYQPQAPAITAKAVDALVGFQHAQQIWDMINSLAARDAPGALKKIEELWSLDPKIEYSATGAVFVWVQQVMKARRAGGPPFARRCDRQGTEALASGPGAEDYLRGAAVGD